MLCYVYFNKHTTKKCTHISIGSLNHDIVAVSQWDANISYWKGIQPCLLESKMDQALGRQWQKGDRKDFTNLMPVQNKRMAIALQ